MLTDLEKFQKINACETVKELEEAILAFADEDGMIQGRTRKFDAERMAKNVWPVVNKQMQANTLTREFGIRQQALYLAYYNK